jgi:hypothetical protein
VGIKLSTAKLIVKMYKEEGRYFQSKRGRRA